VASFFYDERGNVIRQERDTNGDGKMIAGLIMIDKDRLKRLNRTLISMVNPISLFTTKAGKPRRQEIAAKTMAA